MSTKKTFSTKDLEREYGPLTFGGVLRSFRLSDESTLREFARKLGISIGNLCDLEKERKLPSPLRAAKIAEKLGLSAELMIQLCLQDQLRASNLNYTVSIAA